MSAESLLADLSSAGIELWAREGKLQLNAPAGALTPDLRTRLQENKASLLEYFDLPTGLSSAQQRMWFIDQLGGVNSAYVISSAVRIRGDLNFVALQSAIEDLIRRHESLRTTIGTNDGHPIQIVARPCRFSLPLNDISDRPEQLDTLMAQEATVPIDLGRGPLFRAVLYRTAPLEHALLILQHHIISDGWSIGILFRELGALYDGHLSGNPPKLGDLPFQYRDFVRLQEGWLRGEELTEQLNFWRDQLKGVSQELALPTDRPRLPVESHAGAGYSFEIGADLTERLRKLAKREGCTLFMTLLAAFEILLARYSGEQEFLIGTPVANRKRADLESIVGLFVNTVILKVDLEGNPTVSQLLARTRETCLEAFAHQDLPLERLVEELQPERNLNRNPLFQIMFSMHPFGGSALALHDLETTPVPVARSTSQLDLALFLEETAAGMNGNFEYSTDLFDHQTVARMAGHFHQLLLSMADRPETRVVELEILPAVERNHILSDWNDTARDYGDAECVHRMFEAQAARTPEAVALEFQGATLSYSQLNTKANQLARVLRRKGVGPNVLVGVFAERSFEMVIAAMAALKAGGAYVALDPSYPPERLAHMLEDTASPVVLTQPKLANRLPDLPGEVVELDPSWTAFDGEDGTDPDFSTSLTDLVYVIFTSGSTGRPKGAANEHRGFRNYLCWMLESFALTQDDRVLQNTQFGFDAASFEIFLPLICGARVVISEPEKHRDPAYVAEVCASRNISLFFVVPSMLRVVLQDLRIRDASRLRAVVVGGEALTNDLQERFFAVLPRVELRNIYGPAETAIAATHWKCRPDYERPTVPVGTPLSNSRIYILDAQMQPVPAGVAGEVYIGGLPVGRGYAGRDDLTAERFLPDPFADLFLDRDGRHIGNRIYRTGDLARHLPDGVIEYLGRTDFQVKIRGQRVELGEIEAALERHPQISQCVVAAREDVPGDVRLAAYVVALPGVAPEIRDLRETLARHLPSHMVPSAFVLLDALPLNPNGKIDRRALPVPLESALVQNVFVAPESEIERSLTRIWEVVLRLEKVSVEDDFFEIGGHSLLALEVLARVEKTHGIRIPVRAIMEGRTIRQIARILAGQLAPTLPDGIVCVQKRRADKSLFCIPGLGGISLQYQRLASKLRTDRSIYAVEVHDFDVDATVLNSLGETAREAVHRIRQAQNQGPYALLGYSFGGNLAIEMAAELVRKGEQVELLCVIDSFAPGSLQTESRMKRLVRHLRAIVSLGLKDSVAYVGARLKVHWGQTRSRLFGTELERKLALSTISGKRAFEFYVPSRYDGGLTLIRAEKSADTAQGTVWEDNNGWDRFCDNVQPVSISGAHLDLFKEPHLTMLAGHVDDLLAREDQVHDRKLVS